MKTYLVVTNDEYEHPVAEFIGADKVAEFMGVSTNRFRIMLCYGFPKKHKYKAVVIEEMQYYQTPESKKARNQYTAKLRRMKDDRNEYMRNYMRKVYEKARHERDLQTQEVLNGVHS